MKNASNHEPSWYLDPLVAAQKRQINQEWMRKALGARPRGTVLKTDLFEEAYGEDRILHDLFPGTQLGIGIDINVGTSRAAAERNAGAFACFACDVRRVALPDASIDVIVSPSTLDHFDSTQEIADSLTELARILRPGGVLVVTLDNPRNPLLTILTWASRRGWLPFSLGATLCMTQLKLLLEDHGLEVESTDYLIHNPRAVSMMLFLCLRRLLGSKADAPIRWLLKCFALFGKLPTRSFTGCFIAVSAVKRSYK